MYPKIKEALDESNKAATVLKQETTTGTLLLLNIVNLLRKRYSVNAIRLKIHRYF